MVVGMSLYSQIREAYVSGKSIMSNYIIQIRLPDFKCTGKFHFSIILSLASSHRKIYMIRNSPLSISVYSFIKNTVTNILSPAQPIPSVQSSACPHSVLSLKLGCDGIITRSAAAQPQMGKKIDPSISRRVHCPNLISHIAI